MTLALLLILVKANDVGAAATKLCKRQSLRRSSRKGRLLPGKGNAAGSYHTLTATSSPAQQFGVHCKVTGRDYGVNYGMLSEQSTARSVASSFLDIPDAKHDTSILRRA